MSKPAKPFTTKPPGRFDGMKDDLPWEASKPRDPSQGDLPLRGDLGFLSYNKQAAENRRKNSNRQYKPQKGRMKLLMCDACGWKVRAAQSTIDRARNAPCPACI